MVTQALDFVLKKLWRVKRRMRQWICPWKRGGDQEGSGQDQVSEEGGVVVGGETWPALARAGTLTRRERWGLRYQLLAQRPVGWGSGLPVWGRGYANSGGREGQMPGW